MEIEWRKIKRCLLEEASDEERSEVETWKREDVEREFFYERARAYYQNEIFGENLAECGVERAWKKVNHKISIHRVVYHRWVALLAGVAIFTGVIFGIFLFTVNVDRPLSPLGGLANGVQLVVSDGTTYFVNGDHHEEFRSQGFVVDEKNCLKQLAKREESGTGMEQKDEKSVSCNEVIVPWGTGYQLTLADGTRVILNSESRFRFPDKFSVGKREVYLQGEAYFEVSHDENRPFVVHVNDVEIKVLGTEFNVMAYEREKVVTTLVAGGVLVKMKIDSLVLQPGQSCQVAGGDLIVQKADLRSVLAWKNGEFVFKNTRLEDMMKEFSRWYEMEVEYETERLKENRYYIYVERSKVLHEVLDKIALTGRIKYKIEGNKVLIKEP